MLLFGLDCGDFVGNYLDRGDRPDIGKFREDVSQSWTRSIGGYILGSSIGDLKNVSSMVRGDHLLEFRP